MKTCNLNFKNAEIVNFTGNPGFKISRQRNLRESMQVPKLTLKRIWIDLLLNFTIAMT